MSKETYALTVKCTMCTFQVTQQVHIEPDELSKTKSEMLKQAAMIHPKHPDLKNFIVF
jgi:hypothetical protein